MTAYEAARWSDFALAQLGASAALLGLVFVGISINLRDVLTAGSLVHRAAESVIGLGSVLVAATVVLIPAQSRDALGVELIAVAVATFVSVGYMQRDAREPASGPDGSAPPESSVVIRRAFGLGAPLLLLVTALTLLAEGGGGLYWWPAAIVAAYLSALSNAWVLLVEILR